MTVPKLRFPGFENKWSKVNIIQIALDDKSAVKIGPFGSQLKKDYLVSSGVYKVYGQENVFSEDFVKGNRFLNEERFSLLKSSEITPGDIVISMMGTIGKISEVPNHIQKGIMDSHLIRIRLDNNIYLNSFFIQIFKSNNLKKQVEKLSVGSIMSGLSSKIIKSLEFPLTTLTEQNKIASFLYIYDRKIQLQQEKIDLLKEQKKGFMQKIFSQELRFKDEDGQEFPQWEERKLNDFAEKIIIKNKDLKVRNVISNSAKNGLIAQTDYFDKEIANQENINGYYIISNGDFVYNPRISSDAPYGPINIYNGKEDGIVSPLYTCFKVENINKEFLYQYFRSSEWYRFIYLNGDSGARHDRVSIKDSTFLDLPIRIPSPKEQTIIAKFLSNFQKKIIFEEFKLKTQLSQKEAFMQQMFI